MVHAEKSTETLLLPCKKEKPGTAQIDSETHSPMNEHVDFASAPWTPVATGMREKSIDVGPLRYRLVEFTPEFVEDSWCSRGHIGYMIEGELEIAFADHTIRLTKGDGLFIPGGDESKHTAIARSTIALLLLVDEGDAE